MFQIRCLIEPLYKCLSGKAQAIARAILPAICFALASVHLFKAEPSLAAASHTVASAPSESATTEVNAPSAIELSDGTQKLNEDERDNLNESHCQEVRGENQAGAADRQGLDQSPISKFTPQVNSSTESALEERPIKYWGNSFSNKFHRPSCPYAKAMNPTHVLFFHFRKEAIEQGQQPCRYCLPPVVRQVRCSILPKSAASSTNTPTRSGASSQLSN